jgi:outer membrane biosynthesis protein TonB
MTKQWLTVPAFGGMVLAAVLASGCAKAQAARTTPDGPPLEMPASPPREVETTEVEAPPPMPLPQEPARNAPPRTRATPPPQPRPEPPKPEPPKAEPPAPAPPPAAPPVDEQRPPSTLQTKPAGEEGGVERGIRATLNRASSDLNRVDYRTLNTDGRVQYDSAKLFVRQAENEVRKKNLELAKTLADKAAALAAQLAGR